ncbi:hypothetical protein [Eoetvoesiella caeni]|uniref:hypothetical protein n=1 Tax=Eoetvoesiella caeni TaxID=645616 RepID=UPI0011BDD3B6|nr:hypothetical protein [Eoetvoesiella caeni]MCI2811311.1 hypothetical protein [Eoetvoesiella caeni]NYT57190.1 hypothetical protein [Eoetvoesiella caeni]
METDSEVKTFEYTSENGRDDGRFCSIDVVLLNGFRVRHRLRLEGESDDSEPPRNNLSRPDSPIETRIYTDKDLQPLVGPSLRWLKPIAFAAALRKSEYPRQTLILLDYFKHHHSGEVGQLLKEPLLAVYDPALVLGLVARLAIKGYIQLHLGTSIFGYKTPWSLYVKEN